MSSHALGVRNVELSVPNVELGVLGVELAGSIRWLGTALA
jgi:hypothetical protein